MKVDVRNKGVDIVGWFSEKGELNPQHCRLQENRDEYIKMEIQKVLETREEKRGKKRILIYRCQSIVNDCCKEYELTYDVTDCRWELKASW